MSAGSPTTTVDVSTFGAISDGKTDDTVAIQAATNYAASHGLSVSFGSGTYLVTSPINVSSTTAWLGVQGSTNLLAASLNTVLTITNASGVSVRNMNFEGSGDSVSTAAPLLVAYKTTALSLSGDTFAFTGGIAALLSNVNQTSVDQCDFHDIGNNSNLAVDAQAVAYTTDLAGYGLRNSVTSSVFSSIGLDAISATGQDYFLAKENSIGDLRSTEAWRSEAQAPAGVYLNDDMGVEVSDNVIEDAAGNGVDVFNTQGISINSNYIIGNGSSGIALSSTTDGSIESNTTLNNNALSAFVFKGGITIGDHPGNASSSGISINANTSGNTGSPASQPFAIQLYNLASTSTILATNNVFVGSGAQGLVVTPFGFQTPYATENLATTSAASAIEIAGTGSDGPTTASLQVAAAIPTQASLSNNITVPTLPDVDSQSSHDPLVDAAYIWTQVPGLEITGIDPVVWFDTVGWHENVNPDPYFNTSYYLLTNPDVARAGVNPLAHYENFGWKEGRNPSISFDSADYIAAHPSIGAVVDPLLEYVSAGKGQGLAIYQVSSPPDPLVDASYIYAHQPDVAATGLDTTTWYDDYGWKEGANPNAWFDTSFYLRQNPDVAQAGVNPLQHFEAFGWREGREPSLVFSDAVYDSTYADVANAGFDPLLHYITFGQAEGRSVSLAGGVAAVDPLVDPSFYDRQLGATLLGTGTAAAQQAAFSYESTGWKQGFNPNAFFDTGFYLAHNPDVAAAHISPLLHYETYGWREGRDPSAQFSTSGYLKAYADVRAADVDPLLSYIQHGASEGRNPFGQ